MRYTSVQLVYFSPTHTSAKIAYAIAEGMKVTTFAEWDLTYEVPEEANLEDELTVVAVPVYGGRVAETAVERLRNFRADQAPVVPVVVYGNRVAGVVRPVEGEGLRTRGSCRFHRRTLLQPTRHAGGCRPTRRGGPA